MRDVDAPVLLEKASALASRAERLACLTRSLTTRDAALVIVFAAQDAQVVVGQTSPGDGPTLTAIGVQLDTQAGRLRQLERG